MSHEPECPNNPKTNPEGWEANPCYCADLSDAYRRGREDAALAVSIAFIGHSLKKEALGVWVTCFQAARGATVLKQHREGEQA